jgi:hypothetical protein
MLSDDIDDTYLPVDECAARLGLSVPEVMDLLNKQILKARRYGGWLLEVQPALVPGVTTSTTPKKKPTPTKKRTTKTKTPGGKRSKPG